ncbi:MAG: GntR family transcriptional regulator [Chloroflexi bacterium]|nr:GntR family transcriptional regulator [Chloroflexota bacterium]
MSTLSTEPSWEEVPVRDRALRHSVAEHVLAALRSGRLTAGERVHETSLARALGVSLSPVREALFRLADQGLLEHRPRRGFYVTELGEKEVRETYTFRALLEGFAARLAAARCAAARGANGRVHEAAQAMLDAMAALIVEGERAGLAGDRLTLNDCNAKFHDSLVRLADHHLVSRAWALLAPTSWLLVPGSRPAPLTRHDVTDWVERHRRLLSLVRSGDAWAAENEAAAHVRVAGETNLANRLSSGGTPSL